MTKDKDARERVIVGFEGGGTLSLKLTEKDRKGLIDGLAAAGWHDLEDADGPVRLNLSQVVYVRTENEEQRVGFGLG